MLLLTALVLALSVAPAEKPARIPVYITSAGAVNGFTDPDKGSTDTVQDLKERVKDTKSMVLTTDRATATLVVIVQGREATGNVGIGRDRVIRIKLLYAQQEADLSAGAIGGAMGSGGAWGTAATKLARQLDQWVKDNRAQLTR